ncbi:MAG: hypothetical protein NTV34_21640 [Proteobacteria bacterium]|nr:hypothetical protein [Pseudomonadota bacterium]
MSHQGKITPDQQFDQKPVRLRSGFSSIEAILDEKAEVAQLCKAADDYLVLSNLLMK